MKIGIDGKRLRVERFRPLAVAARLRDARRVIGHRRVLRAARQGFAAGVVCIRKLAILEVRPGQCIVSEYVMAHRQFVFCQAQRLVQMPVMVGVKQGALPVIDDALRAGQNRHRLDEE